MPDERLTVRQALGTRAGPLTVFFRDDDAGWADERLQTLCSVFGAANVPLDLAVIPAAITGRTERILNQYCAESPGLFHLHQHGFSHENHQSAGRKCEFGSARSLALQQADIFRGQCRLRRCFDDRIEPIFTPPWNRCTQQTVAALEAEGLSVLSRDIGATALRTQRLFEIPVSVDWFRKHNGRRLSADAWEHYAARSFARLDAVGVMLHHEIMDANEIGKLNAFLRELRSTGLVVFKSIMEIYRSAKLTPGLDTMEVH